MKKEISVYRFKAKVMGGEWLDVVDYNRIPISIRTNKGPNDALKMFKRKYPSIADLYIVGETLIAERDPVATKSIKDYEEQKKAEQEERIRKAWWQD